MEDVRLDLTDAEIRQKIATLCGLSTYTMTERSGEVLYVRNSDNADYPFDPLSDKELLLTLIMRFNVTRKYETGVGFYYSCIINGHESYYVPEQLSYIDSRLTDIDIHKAVCCAIIINYSIN